VLVNFVVDGFVGGGVLGKLQVNFIGLPGLCNGLLFIKV
jgi:hypothetical protein